MKTSHAVRDCCQYLEYSKRGTGCSLIEQAHLEWGNFPHSELGKFPAWTDAVPKKYSFVVVEAAEAQGKVLRAVGPSREQLSYREDS